MSVRHRVGFAASLVLALAFAPGSAAAQMPAATAELSNPDGRNVGTVELIPTPNGVLLQASLHDLAPGTHAFHIHETGSCEPPFTSAGGHLSEEGVGHGFLDGDGVHAGDLPNVTVAHEGTLRFDVFVRSVRVGDSGGGGVPLMDEDGSAIVMHEGADDYRTNPAGAAGSRIACGVIR